MMNGKLPTKLGVQPIIDAILEVRLEASIDVSLILPGLLMQQLGSGVRVEKLPLSEMPDVIRRQDQELRYQPVIRIFHDEFLFLIGTSSICVGCVIPYPGWDKFKAAILLAINVLHKSGIATKVFRYSIKYVDLLELPSSGEVFKYLNVDIKFAGYNATNYPMNVNIQIPDDGFLHSIQAAGPAHIRLLDGTEKNGTALTVDTLAIGEVAFDDFVIGLGQKLDAIHHSNKKKFFSCLNEEALDKLEARYD